MAVTLQSATPIGRASALLQRDPTAAEAAAFKTHLIDLCFDPSERAMERPGAAFRDRARGLICTATGASAGTINSNPALDFPDSGLISVSYQIAPSYFMACAVDLDSLTDNAALINGQNNGDANRLQISVRTNGRIWVSHSGNGFTQGSAGQVVTTGTPHVIWASYDDSDNTVQVGLDAKTPQFTDTGTITGTHSGALLTEFFGSSQATFPIDGRAQMLVCAALPLGKAAHDTARGLILDMIAERAGVTLAA